MNKIQFRVLGGLAFMIMMIFAISSCTPDACADIDCGSHGTCVEDANGVVTCQCDEGWEMDANGIPCNATLCENITCQNGGTCTNGVCDCPAGFTGTNCETATITAYIGSWLVAESCNPGVNTATCAPVSSGYLATIQANGTSTTSTAIINFWDTFANSVVADVNGNTITITYQVPDSDGYGVSGSGTLTDNVITFSYTVTDTNQTPNCVNSCTATWTKQ